MDLSEILAEISAADDQLTAAKGMDQTAAASKSAADAAAATAATDAQEATDAHTAASVAAQKAISDLQAYFGVGPTAGPAAAARGSKR